MKQLGGAARDHQSKAVVYRRTGAPIHIAEHEIKMIHGNLLPSDMRVGIDRAAVPS